MMPEIQNWDGALYADLTPITLGLPAYTPMCHVPIPYGDLWRQMGEDFKEQAQSICPIDTGYLRDHIGFNADAGGLEVWSDAKYSVYQEYGTSKMRAQPYFESSLMSAISNMEGAMWNMADEYLDMDGDLYFLTVRGGRQGSLQECYADLARLDQVIAFMEKENKASAANGGWVYNLTALYEAKEEISQRIIELTEMESQMQKPGVLGFLSQVLAMMISSLLMSPIIIFETLLEDTFGGIDADHQPIH